MKTLSILNTKLFQIIYPVSFLGFCMLRLLEIVAGDCKNSANFFSPFMYHLCNVTVGLLPKERWRLFPIP